MNKDILKGNWKQIRGRVKQAWGRITDDELDEINGLKDQLIGKVQKHYGYSRKFAEDQVDFFVDVVKKDLR